MSGDGGAGGPPREKTKLLNDIGSSQLVPGSDGQGVFIRREDFRGLNDAAKEGRSCRPRFFRRLSGTGAIVQTMQRDRINPVLSTIRNGPRARTEKVPSCVPVRMVFRNASGAAF